MNLFESLSWYVLGGITYHLIFRREMIKEIVEKLMDSGYIKYYVTENEEVIILRHDEKFFDEEDDEKD